MKTRQLTFDSTNDDDKKTFNLLWGGFISGAAVEGEKNQKRNFSDRGGEVAAARALKRISFEEPNSNGTQRNLKEGTQVLSLNDAAFETLRAYIRSAQWVATVMDEVDDLLLRLDQSPAVE